jgi:hypothetical protein
MSSSPVSTILKIKIKYYQLFYSLEHIWNKTEHIMHKITIWNPLFSSGSTRKSQMPYYLMDQGPQQRPTTAFLTLGTFSISSFKPKISNSMHDMSNG